MNRFTRGLLVMLGGFGLVALFLVASTPASAQMDTQQISEFVQQHLPTVRGEVVDVRSDTGFVSLDESTDLNQLPIQVVRKSLSRDNGQQQLMTEVVGTSSLFRGTDQLWLFRKTRSMTSTPRPGDNVRFQPATIIISDPDERLPDGTQQALRKLQAVQEITTNIPPVSQGPVFELNWQNGTLQLKKAGEMGSLGVLEPGQQTQATQRRPAPEVQARSTRRSGVRTGQIVEQKTSISKILTEFEWVPLPDNPNTKVVAFSAGQEIGFARWDDGIKSLKWHELSGEVVEIDVLAERMDSLERLPLLVVTKSGNELTTRFAYYDLINRRVVNQWRDQNVWLSDIGGTIYGVQIGLSTPFKKQLHPVKVTKQTWDWQETPETVIPKNSVPSAVNSVSGRVFRISSEGVLEVFSNSSLQVSSSADYGGHPMTIQSRRQEKASVQRQPGFAVWQAGTDSYRILIPNNPTSGVMFFSGLQSFSQSRLYLLEEKRGRLRTIRESQRLPGYVTHVEWGHNAPWAAVVDTEQERSRIYSIPGIKRKPN